MTNIQLTAPDYSPAPWSFEYSPYRSRRGEDGIESELPAFEVFDADCNKVFDTNEDTPPNFRRQTLAWGHLPQGCWPHSSCARTICSLTTRDRRRRGRCLP